MGKPPGSHRNIVVNSGWFVCLYMYGKIWGWPNKLHCLLNGTSWVNIWWIFNRLVSLSYDERYEKRRRKYRLAKLEVKIVFILFIQFFGYFSDTFNMNVPKNQSFSIFSSKQIFKRHYCLPILFLVYFSPPPTHWHITPRLVEPTNNFFETILECVCEGTSK